MAAMDALRSYGNASSSDSYGDSDAESEEVETTEEHTLHLKPLETEAGPSMSENMAVVAAPVVSSKVRNAITHSLITHSLSH